MGHTLPTQHALQQSLCNGPLVRPSVRLSRRSTAAAAVSVIRYDTRRYFNVRSKADTSQIDLPHVTNNKKVDNKKKLKSKHGYAQKYRQTVRGIREVSPKKKRKATVGRVYRKGRLDL